MRYWLSLIALVLAMGPSMAEERILLVPRDAPIHISNPHNWSDDCRIGWIRVYLTRAPNHGRVYVEEISHRIGDFGQGRLTSGEMNGCVCPVIEGAGLFYDPNDGYAGPDGFSVKVTFEFIPDLEVDYRVTVGP